jgi:hypothetical protein
MKKSTDVVRTMLRVLYYLFDLVGKNCRLGGSQYRRGRRCEEGELSWRNMFSSQTEFILWSSLALTTGLRSHLNVDVLVIIIVDWKYTGATDSSSGRLDASQTRSVVIRRFPGPTCSSSGHG